METIRAHMIFPKMLASTAWLLTCEAPVRLSSFPQACSGILGEGSVVPVCLWLSTPPCQNLLLASVVCVFSAGDTGLAWQ